MNLSNSRFVQYVRTVLTYNFRCFVIWKLILLYPKVPTGEAALDLLNRTVKCYDGFNFTSVDYLLIRDFELTMPFRHIDDMNLRVIELTNKLTDDSTLASLNVFHHAMVNVDAYEWLSTPLDLMKRKNPASYLNAAISSLRELAEAIEDASVINIENDAAYNNDFINRQLAPISISLIEILKITLIITGDRKWKRRLTPYTN